MPGPLPRRDRWWIPVAILGLLGVAAIALTVGSRDGGRAMEPATTGGPEFSTTLPASTDMREVTPSATELTVAAAPLDTVASTDLEASTTTTRHVVGAATTILSQPTSTWVPGLEGVGWTLGGPFPHEITACETSEYMAAIFDPYDITTSLTLSWSYTDASATVRRGEVALRKSWFQHLASEWRGTFVPVGPPASELTHVYQTLTATDADGNSKEILSTSHLLWLSPCTDPATTTTPSSTESSTTVTTPLP